MEPVEFGSVFAIWAVGIISFTTSYQHNMLHIHVQNYEQDTNMWNIHRKSQNTRNWFRYETFIYLFEFKVFSTWGERDAISFYADFSIWIPARAAPPLQTTGLALASSENRLSSSKPKSQLQLIQPTRGAHSAQSRLASPRSESQLFFFLNLKILSASGHDVIHVPFPIWGFYCDISYCYIRPACVWTPVLNVCT